MKFLLFFLLFTTIFVEIWMKEFKCKNEGCFEVIKTFAELLEKKINESNAILAEAETQLNEITYGNDESFKRKIKEVDDKLASLIADVTTGVDGGDKSLVDLINSVFDDVREIEYLTDESVNLAENAAKNAGSSVKNVKNIEELIREIQDELNRLQNATTLEGPEALQNAFDRSEKFDSNSKELKDVLGQVKAIVKDYEVNLLNAKMLTASAIEKFAKVETQVNQTLVEQKEVDDKLKEALGMDLTKEELENIKKLVKEVLDKANVVYEEAFDLLNEVSAFELEDKLEAINEKVKKLDETADVTNLNMQTFSEDNASFLEEMEATIDTAEKAEKKAFDIQADIEILLIEINAVHDQAKKAIFNENTLIEDAKKIHSSLENFQLKVEESRENARRALEKIPKILQKVKDSEALVENMHKQLNDQYEFVYKAKTLCSNANEDMQKILEECEDIQAKIDQLGIDFENLPEDNIEATKQSNDVSDKIDKLEQTEAEDNALIEATKEKIEKTKLQAAETDGKVEEALKTLGNLADQIKNLKNFDEATLNDLEGNLLNAEKELDNSGLDGKILDLKAKRHDQTMLMKNFSEDIAELEYQISVLKKNAESLEARCFKRTRLEP